MTVLAHGIGGRVDLPVPFRLALIAAALAVIASFAALAALWPRSRSAAATAGRPVPAGVARVLDARALRWTARLLVLAASVLVVLIGYFGSVETNFNLAPWVLYITFWVGLVPASLLLGPVWRAVNPVRTLYAGWTRALGLDPRPARRARRADRGARHDGRGVRTARFDGVRRPDPDPTLAAAGAGPGGDRTAHDPAAAYRRRHRRLPEDDLDEGA